MRRVSGFEPPFDLRGAVFAVGTFDGCHRGQQAVLARARGRAGREGRPFVVVTLGERSDGGDAVRPTDTSLTTLEQRCRLFARAGADVTFVLDTDGGVPALDAIGALLEAAQAEAVLVHERLAAVWRSVDPTAERPDNLPFRRLEIVPATEDGQGVITSERIRDHLRAGECGAATGLLGRPFAVEGVVQHGHKLGRTIGFPTANLLMGGYVRPAYGVYAVRGRLPGGRVIDGVANLGVRPTMEVSEELLEPHFLDYTGDLYGETIEVEFIAYLRGEEKLSSFDELKIWIQRDCDRARDILAGTPHIA